MCHKKIPQSNYKQVFEHEERETGGGGGVGEGKRVGMMKEARKRNKGQNWDEMKHKSIK